jgi:hypothetical protein
MSMRQGWTYNGTHFTKTTTERGGTRYFVDGTPVKHADWRARLTAAIRRDAAKPVGQGE